MAYIALYCTAVRSTMMCVPTGQWPQAHRPQAHSSGPSHVVACVPAEVTSGGLPARLALMNEFLDLGPREQAPLEHHRVSLKTVGRHVATFLFGVVLPSTETASWMWFHPKAW